MTYLWRVSASTMTAASVVSLPVPAVVGMAISRGSLCQIFRMPAIFPKGFLGRASRAPTALAQSMGEPPPKATRQSQPLSRYSFSASSTILVVGLGRVPS